MAQRGWVANHDGNVSARTSPSRFVCTPTATAKGVIRAQDLLATDPQMKVLSGRGRPFSEYAIHMAIGTPMIRMHAADGPRNTTGRRLGTPDHFVYGRRNCPVCAIPLQSWDERTSPWGRRSNWCPTCQRIEPVRAVDLDRARRLLALHPVRRDPLFPARVAEPS